jgi:ABC transporter DrrB family efflux protein
VAPSRLVSQELVPASHSWPYWTVADTLVMAARQLKRIRRTPDELVTSFVEPILLVVLFRYVFGGAITVHGTSYSNFLLPGIMVQSIILGSLFSGVGIATDLQRGLVDRFRSLPMAKSAVLTGRLVADLVRSTVIVIAVWTVGLAVGFRPSGSAWDWLGAIGLLLIGSFMFSWFSALQGVLLRSIEAVQQAFLIWALPFMFASSAFVPTSTLPDWLRPFVEHQPVSVLIDAIRGLVLDRPDWMATVQAIAWCLCLLAVFIPAAVWGYGHRTSR